MNNKDAKNTPQELNAATNKAMEALGALPNGLLVPENNDSRVAQWASDSFLNQKLAFNSQQGWLLYSGKHWQPLDPILPREILSRMLKELFTQIHSSGGSRHDLDRVERLLSRARLTAVTELLAGTLYRDHEWFDRYRELLNVNNGVVDLRTGEVFPHSAEFGFTRITSGNYWPDYAHPDWEKALQALEPEVREFVQDRFGQALTGYTPPDEKLIFFMGDGSNGKSTIIEGSRAAFGSFAIDVQEKLLLANPSDHPVEKLILLGARIGFLEELPDGHRIGVKRLKDLTRPTMTARDIGKSNFTWSTSHTLFISTNYDSTLDEVDHGTWRRLIRIPFTKTFTSTPDPSNSNEVRGEPGLKERIIAGLEGQHDAIVTWSIQGAIRFYGRSQNFLPAPPTVSAATENWRNDNDKIIEFFHDEIELNPDFYIASSDLLTAFNVRMKLLGYRAWGANTFGQRIKQHPALKDYLANPGRVRVGGPTRLIRSEPHGFEYFMGSAKQLICWEGIRFKDHTPF
jgi:P4 family phage/plasmid primase-like protien